MSASPTTRGARGLRPRDIPTVVDLLEDDFGRHPGRGAAANQFLLDALDRGEHERFAVWPDRATGAVIYVGQSGTVVPAGDPAGAPALAEVADGTAWRVLIGDAPIAGAVVEHAGRGIFRRRANAREQRFMVAERVPSVVHAPVGMRPADLGDLGEVTAFACGLHVEDRMGPPIPRSGRAGVRSRMRESILRGGTWVIERSGRLVGKVDLSIRSVRRGAQIAGVYVDDEWRGHGIAGDCVAAIARELLDQGLPAVTLHVRSDNAPAIRAYGRAGFVDWGPWVLAIR
jgi:uncharacterized protein